jgi:hypothetical protein
VVLIRKIAARFISREAPQRPRIAAFGKHPGWNDHIDDIGLETDLLVMIKRLLYVEGIGGNIDSGAWEALQGDQQIADFDHVFVYRAGMDLVIGRFWSSSDGKGRTRYPMVVCADCSGHSVPWSLAQALPELEKIKAGCQQTKVPQEVAALIQVGSSRLAAAAAQDKRDQPPGPSVLSLLAARPEMGPDGLGFNRVLYQTERELGAYRRGPSRSRSAAQPQHLRVPACAEGVADRTDLWLRFVHEMLDPVAPIMLLVPVSLPWVDILVGAAAPAQFFCIRASSRAVPLTTEIPYSLDAEFLGKVRQLLHV